MNKDNNYINNGFAEQLRRRDLILESRWTLTTFPSEVRNGRSRTQHQKSPFPNFLVFKCDAKRKWHQNKNQFFSLLFLLLSNEKGIKKSQQTFWQIPDYFFFSYLSLVPQFLYALKRKKKKREFLFSSWLKRWTLSQYCSTHAGQKWKGTRNQ